MELIPWRTKRPQEPKIEDEQARPRIWSSQIQFSDGSTIETDKNDVVIIVGPNNGGKSATLRAIASKLKNDSTPSPVVRGIVFKRQGSAKDVEAWLEASTKVVPKLSSDEFELFGNSIDRYLVSHRWEKSPAISELSGFFCTFLGTR